jgi:PAS domain S-box-containing protein
MTDVTLPEETLSSAMVDALQKAFGDFQLKAERLSVAYGAMQADFKRLNLELDGKNKELAESLARHDETQTYLNSILESMNNGVVGIDCLGAITLFNRAAANITGFGAAWAIGRKYTDVFPRERESGQSLPRVLVQGRGHEWDEKVIWHKDEFPVPVSFQTALLKDGQGSILGAVEIFSDISRIKAH